MCSGRCVPALRSLKMGSCYSCSALCVHVCVCVSVCVCVCVCVGAAPWRVPEKGLCRSWGRGDTTAAGGLPKTQRSLQQWGKCPQHIKQVSLLLDTLLGVEGEGGVFGCVCCGGRGDATVTGDLPKTPGSLQQWVKYPCLSSQWLWKMSKECLRKEIFISDVR